jgi:hypothetical protein
MFMSGIYCITKGEFGTVVYGEMTGYYKCTVRRVCGHASLDDHASNDTRFDSSDSTLSLML